VRGKTGGIRTALKRSSTSVHEEKERCGVGTLPPPLRLIDAISCLVLFGSAILI
jgi:hypothetical protein